ncbi:MAG: hypothetical protein ACJ8FY_25130, partial [Gemmataceae bacterium]
MKELRPKIDEQVRKMVERAVDVPEAEEFGAIDFEFRDARQKMANEVRQASVASRKKKGYVGCSVTCAYCDYAANTPDKEHTRYLVDFELDALAEQVRQQAQALGVSQVSDLIAATDGGNGLEEALQRHLADNLTTIMDWYHAAEHLCTFAKVWHVRDFAACQ